jgi:predicted nucleotidyltransferase
MNLTDTDKDNIRKILALEPYIEVAYLYGSVAIGLAREDSDIDIGVLINSSYIDILDYKFESNLALKIEGVLKKEVDLRIINKAPIYAQYEVIKPAQLIYSANDSVRINFETQVLSQYFDMLPYWKLYDKYRSHRIERGEFGA